MSASMGITTSAATTPVATSTATKKAVDVPAPLDGDAAKSAAELGTAPGGNTGAATAVDQAKVGADKKPAEAVANADAKPKADAKPAGAAPKTDAKPVVADAKPAATAKVEMNHGDMAGMNMGTKNSAGVLVGKPMVLPETPPKSDPRFKDGSTGPTVAKGKAELLKIPDGAGFAGKTGRQQNADDKSKNNYSVTDANFSNKLGLLAKDPDTGEEMTYTKHIQTYNAAGYIQSFAADTWAGLTKAQDADAGKAGGATILEGSAYLMGLTKTKPTWLDAAGITGADIPQTIPGTNRSSKEFVASLQDVTGQDWARPHHAASSWDMYQSLTNIGVDGEKALRLAGDDGVSGSGRLNGVNGQDGNNGFNAGEVDVFKEGARLQQETGLPVIEAMMTGHDHVGLDPSALTNPAANAIIGYPAGDRSVSTARATAIKDALLAGRLDENNNANKANNGGNAGNAGNAGGANAAGNADAGGNGGGAAAAGGGGGGGAKQNLVSYPFLAPEYTIPANQLNGSGIVHAKIPGLGDARFTDGSVGPLVAKGKAKTITIADGLGFGGLAGRQQNAGDKAQNNYSVTDANFNNEWGILSGANGKPLNYVQQIQLYSAGGYLQQFAPEIYDLLVAIQDAGGPTILEMAGRIMGLFDGADATDALGADRIAAIDAAMGQVGIGQIGVDPRLPANIPGTNMDAKTYVSSPKDITGQDWARPHHAASSWQVLKSLLANGVPQDIAFVLSGDDAVSGSGRLNGVNNQDGDDSFNADEAAVWRYAAEFQNTYGIPVIQLMMAGHHQLMLDPSAMTKPNINKLIGLDPNDTSPSAERAAAITAALLSNDKGINIGNVANNTKIKEQRLIDAQRGIASAPMAITNATAGAAMVGMGGMAGMNHSAGMTMAPAAAAPAARPAPVAAAAAPVTVSRSS